MPLSDSELKGLKAGAKRKVVSAGDSLFVVVESVGKGGGKSFLGITRFPPGGGGKRVEVRIGPYGRGCGQMDPESSKGKVGKHQDLEQGDRQRPQRTEKRTTRGRWAREDPPRRFRTP